MRRTVLLVMTLVLGLAASSARADRRVDGLVAKLRADPVVVSTALTRSVPPREVAALRRVVAAASVPLFVVVAPSFSGEAGLQTLDALPDLLHDGLDRDGIYLATDRSGSVYAQAFGVRPRFSLRDLPGTVHDDRPDAEPGEAARYAVRLLTTGRRAPVAKRPREPEEGSVQGLAVVLAGLGGGTLAFVVTGWPWITAARRRSTAVPVVAPAGLDSTALGEQARAALVELSGALAAADGPPPPAFDGYAAASKLLEDAHGPVEFVAALELMRAATGALTGRPGPPCFFDPRHGAGTKRTRWRLGLHDTRIPACGACAKAVAQGRTPPALADRGRPYFERDTLWARTGFGAIDEALPARVLAGEARR